MLSIRFRFALLVLVGLAVFSVWWFVLRRGFIGEFHSDIRFSHIEGKPVATDCPRHSGLLTYDQWRQQVTFPYAAPKERTDRIRSNYDRVHVGSSDKEIIEAFGAPDFEQLMFPKEVNRPCMGYEWMYYFQKPTEMVNELKDKKVIVFLLPNGAVRRIVENVGLANN